MYFNDNLEFYHYYRRGATSLDENYFIRGKSNIRLFPDTFHFFTDKYFSTSHDCTVATIMAYDMLIVYLKKEIDNLENKNGMETVINPFQKQSRLFWNANKTDFFDRGFLDTPSYAELIESEPSERMKSYAENWRYYTSVFLLPPWQEIYETDNERKQDWKEAVLIFEKMSATYKSYGNRIIEIPKKSVSERADFILEFIEQNRIENNNTNTQQWL